jgi:hypothetical protein
MLCVAAFAVAQMNTGEISGAVRDQTAAALVGATVVAEQATTGLRFTSTVDASGEYLLAQLPVGNYRVIVNAAGFKQAELPSVAIHVGDRLRREFTLEVGSVGETIVVTEGDSALQLESAEIKDTVREEQVIALPLRGRKFLDLAMLSEGVVRPPGGTRGDAMQQAGTLVNVLGQRSGHNLYLIDGTTATDQYFNNMVISPSVDYVQEFNIEKTSYTPEFGGKSGAVINVITKSGTNALHGSLFEFVRNDIFDAKNYFDSPTAPIPPFRQNQFGATVGGPIVPNRMFFSASYEGQRIRKSLTQTFSVPTAEMRAGNFTGQPAIYDPTNVVAGQRQPFANNFIPAGRRDPVALALLNHIPLPNLPGVAQNLRAVETQRSALNAYGGRIDHQFGPNDNAFVRAMVFDADDFSPFGSGVLQESLLPGFGRNLTTNAVSIAASWSHVFSPYLLNEFRAGWMGVKGGQSSPNAGNPFAAQAGLAGVTTDPRDMGFPQVSLGGQFSTMGDPSLFTYRDNKHLEFYDNVIWHRGRHTIKFGGYFFKFDFQPVNPNAARGLLAFSPRWTSSVAGGADGNAFADFLLGYPTTAQVGLGRAEMDADALWVHSYIQDGWQVTPNLRFDFGLRYEYNRNMTESQSRMAAIDMSVPGGRYVIASDNTGNISPAANALLPLIPIPYVTSSAAGWNRSLLNPSDWRFAPRAGLAWNVPGLRTVVRAGFGIYPNQAAYSIITNFSQNLPFFGVKTVNTPATDLTPTQFTSSILTTTTLGTVGGSNLDHRFLIEYNEVWNLNIEHAMASGMLFSAAYIGSRTVHADSATVLNVPTPGSGFIAARRPIPQLSQFNTIRWDGWADYQALTLKVERRMGRGLMFNTNWTWSHSIDDASDPGATLNEANLPQDVYNRRMEKASSSFDHRHRFVVSFTYDLPFTRVTSGWKSGLLGNWRASGNFAAQSGAPFTVNYASDRANVGAGPAQRPNMNGDPNHGPRTPEQWLDTAVFSLPAQFTFGNTPRSAVIGPGSQEFDLSLQKELTLTETTKLQLRSEVYNLFNHPNFNIPNRTAFTPNFGRISSAQDSRQMQFAIRMAF